jgi:L-lactate dehydrogenase complex protein LldG
METVTTKEQVLKKIRQGLMNKAPGRNPDVDLESPIYNANIDNAALLFAQQFTQVAGEFIYCDNRFDFIDNLITLIETRRWSSIYCWENALQDQLKDADIKFVRDDSDLESMEAGITLCEGLVARTASVMVTSRQKAGRRLTIYPPAHIVVAYTSQLVFEIKDALQLLKNKYGSNLPSMISFITGPSRTADIEQTMVIGAHGPKELYVFLIEDMI